jgi:GTP-binding protein
MPGYGFAKAPKDVVKKWRFLINDFLRGRQVLKRVLVLIDARHGIKDVDRDILEDARQGGGQLPHRPDQGRQDQGHRTCQTSPRRPPRKSASAPPRIRRSLATSSETGLGIAELRAAVIEAITA